MAVIFKLKVIIYDFLNNQLRLYNSTNTTNKANNKHS